MLSKLLITRKIAVSTWSISIFQTPNISDVYGLTVSKELLGSNLSHSRKFVLCTCLLGEPKQTERITDFCWAPSHLAEIYTFTVWLWSVTCIDVRFETILDYRYPICETYKKTVYTIWSTSTIMVAVITWDRNISCISRLWAVGSCTSPNAMNCRRYK